MELTADQEQRRERLISMILSAKTLPEIAQTRQMLQDWLMVHPDDLGILDGFDHLAMSRSLAEDREAVQKQAA